MPDDNERETGARAPQPKRSSDSRGKISQQAAENRKPADKFGNTAPVDETEEETRHSDGQNPPGVINPDGGVDDRDQPDPQKRADRARRPTPSPATEKVSGAGPAIAERSKDAKAPKGGRQPGAYVKR